MSEMYLDLVFDVVAFTLALSFAIDAKTNFEAGDISYAWLYSILSGLLVIVLIGSIMTEVVYRV